MTTHGRSGIGTRLFLWILRRIFSLRYRVRVRGLDEVAARGTRGILFLSNHPALLDPAMLTMWLYPRFSTRALADAVQINRPVVGWLARKFGTRVMPSLDREGPAGVEPVRRVLAEAIAGLQQGENLLLYPAGHMKRRTAEEIGAASAARAILDGAPDLRVVLIRQNGFWGSSFSYGLTGQPPSLAGGFKRGFKSLLLNVIFFVPRRPVDVELVEPSDLPRAADRLVLNRYLETFYNAGAARNRYVPYGFWERGGIREVPDPPGARKGSDVGSVPAAIQQQVVEQLVQVSGKPTPVVTDELANDLGLDSLAVAELVTWVESEFGFSVGSPDSLVTVGDVMVAAAGRGVSAAETEIRSAGASWFAERGSERLELPPGSTVTEVFLRQASLGPDRVILADQTSGERTYRDLVLVMMLLKPLVEKLPGEYVGIMMPASVGAAVFYLTALFAGKTPVMVNWTTGSRNLTHSLDLLGVTHVITARALVDRLAALGTDVSALGDRFVFAEDLRAQMSIGQKLSALVRSRFSWRSLWRAKPTETAVVLFTSGSESMPKAVPLTHGNILTNIRDTLAAVSVIKSDVLIGMLPPFHSFGIVETICLTTLSSMRAVYHPNPTESAVLARVVEAYQVTLLVGTPTFLNGVVRVAQPRELDSLRLAVTGAEKCPESIYASIEERCPQLTVIEGYGITECSPIVSINPIEAPVRGSIGRLLGSLEGVIVGVEREERVPPGETGMLLVRGPSVFTGYLKHDGASPFVTFEGKSWYRTGDLVSQTDDGVLFFQGRLKRFVKIGGEMISLPAIETALWPRIAHEKDEGPAMAIESVGDQESPEITLFCIRPVDRAEVNGWLREAGFSPIYNVRQVVTVESIPVLGTGKTDYRRLKDEWVAKQATPPRA